MAYVSTNEMTAIVAYIRHWISADGKKKKRKYVSEWKEEKKRWRADHTPGEFTFRSLMKSGPGKKKKILRVKHLLFIPLSKTL